MSQSRPTRSDATPAAGLLLLALAAAACGDRTAPPAAGPLQAERVVVAVTPARLLPVDRTIEVVGTLRGDVEATVSSKRAGRIAAVLRDWGGTVAPGEPLARLETVDLELERAAAAAALRETLSRLGLEEPPKAEFDPGEVPAVRKAHAERILATARRERSRVLLADPAEIVSVQDYEDLESAVAVAEAAVDAELLLVRALLAAAATRSAELAAVEQRLADAVVRAPPLGPAADAPAAGDRVYRVAERTVEVGDYVREGTPLFRIVVDDPLRYQARVPERLAGAVAVGQEVELRADATSEPRSGVVRRVAPAADESTRTVLIEATVANPDRRLVPGTFARGSIRVRRDEGVLFVPQDALVRGAGVTRVFVVEDGAARGIEIETGVRQGAFVEVARGLSDAVAVVTSGASRLANGTLVAVKDAAALGEVP